MIATHLKRRQLGGDDGVPDVVKRQIELCNLRYEASTTEEEKSRTCSFSMVSKSTCTLSQTCSASKVGAMTEAIYAMSRFRQAK